MRKVDFLTCPSAGLFLPHHLVMARSTSDLPGPLRTRVRENARIIVVPGCCIFYSSLILVLLFQLIAIVIGFGSTVQLLLRSWKSNRRFAYIHMLLRASLCARMNIQGKFYASKLNNNQVTSTYSTITTTSCIDTVL